MRRDYPVLHVHVGARIAPCATFQDQKIAAENAASVIFVMLVVAIAGRITFGKLADMIGALQFFMTATAWMTLLIFGFSYIANLQRFYFYAIIYGFGYAGVMIGGLVSIRALIPQSRRASAFGIVTMFGWFGHAIGGFQGRILYDLTGSYTGTLWGCYTDRCVEPHCRRQFATQNQHAA